MTTCTLVQQLVSDYNKTSKRHIDMVMTASWYVGLNVFMRSFTWYQEFMLITRRNLHTLFYSKCEYKSALRIICIYCCTCNVQKANRPEEIHRFTPGSFLCHYIRTLPHIVTKINMLMAHWKRGCINSLTKADIFGTKVRHCFSIHMRAIKWPYCHIGMYMYDLYLRKYNQTYSM